MEFSDRLARQGVTLLDAPVSGGEPARCRARSPSWWAGSGRRLSRCRPLLSAWAKRLCMPDRAGRGRNQDGEPVVAALNLLAAVEGVRLRSRRAGRGYHVSAVGAGAAGSWMWSNLARRWPAATSRRVS